MLVAAADVGAFAFAGALDCTAADVVVVAGAGVGVVAVSAVPALWHLYYALSGLCQVVSF